MNTAMLSCSESYRLYYSKPKYRVKDWDMQFLEEVNDLSASMSDSMEVPPNAPVVHILFTRAHAHTLRL